MLKRNPGDRINFEDFSTHEFLLREHEAESNLNTSQNFSNSFESNNYIEQQFQQPPQQQTPKIQNIQHTIQDNLKSKNKNFGYLSSNDIKEGSPEYKKPIPRPNSDLIGMYLNWFLCVLN